MERTTSYRPIEDATDKLEEATGKMPELTDKIEKATDKREEATDKREEATDKREEATDKREEATDKREEATDKKEGATDKMPEVIAKIEGAIDKVEEATEKKEDATDKVEEATNKMIEATSSPNLQITNTSESLGAKLADDNKGEQEENDSEDEDDEETEEEEVETEMTLEEKKAMYEAVKSGDIDVLEDCLDKPNSDITIVWYKENLLMAAIRHGQKEMAEFLLDNGVDHAYSTSVVELRKTSRGIMLDKYDLTCRQMAYDHGLLDIVQLIDLLEGNLFPFVHPPARTPRQRRQRMASVSEDNDSLYDADDDSSTGTSDPDNDKSIISGTVSDEETTSRNNEKENRKKKLDDTINENDNNEEGDNETVVDDMADDSMHKDEHNDVRKKKRKHKTTKGDSNSNVVGDQVETEGQETLNTNNADLRYNRAGSISLTSAALPHQKELLIIQSLKASTENQLKNKLSEISMKDPRPQKKPVKNRRLLKEIDRKAASLEGIPSTSLPELKPAWLTQPTNRIWSSKSALVMERANKHPSNNGFKENYQNRPLKWKKVSMLGSYTSESKHWHSNERAQLASSEEFTEITAIRLSTALPLKSSKESSLLPKCQKQNNTSRPFSTNIRNSAGAHISDVNNSTIKTSMHAARVQPPKYKTNKTRLTPKFFNSYEVLNFIPGVPAS